MPEPFKDIQGNISFSNRHVSAESISASWYGLPLKARIDVLDDGTSLLSTHLEFEFDQSGKGPSELVPEWLRGELHGRSAWAAALRIGADTDMPLRLSSDLVGTQVSLPAPIGKTAEAGGTLEMSVGGQKDVPLHLAVEYKGRFGADLRFGRRGGQFELDSAALRLGPGPLIEARDRGITLGGASPELDARAWYEALERMGLSGGSGEELLRAVDLHVGKARWGDYWIEDTRYQWQPDGAGGWTLALTGTGANGDMHWTPADDGRVAVRLNSLNLRSAEQADSQRPPGDPGSWPVVDLDAAKFRLNKTGLGRLRLVSERVENGQRTRIMSLNGADTTLSANGEWRRSAEGSSARLEFDLVTSDIAGVLDALDYAPNLEAESGRVRGDVAWDPAPQGLEWQMARGSVSVSFSDGQLRAVEPGAGRVLGLMNFMALPRRLTLNFSDVVSDGLGYDTITGDFELADGDATTSNLKVDGPSVRMETSGRIGLAARNYDQTVTVYPGVSAGVTLGALALGGPVIGVLTLIAQEIMDKPLDEVSQLTYHLTGSWDNPRVERVGGSDDEDARKRKPGPPSQK